MECKYCQDNVTMPFTCSLCSQKYCSKHRLPETHDCVNIGHFNTDVYRKQKVEKSKLPMNTIAIGESFGNPRYAGQPGTWTSGNIQKDILIGGLVLGIASVMFHFIKNQNFVVLLGAIFYAIIGMFLIFQLRSTVAKRYDIITIFMLWPIGVALTIIASILNFRMVAFGYYFNTQGGSLRSEALIGYVSAISIFMIYVIGNIFADVTGGAFVSGFSLVARSFISFGIINILPLDFLDGKKMYDYNNRNYFLFIIGMAFTIVYLAINVF